MNLKNTTVWILPLMSFLLHVLALLHFFKGSAGFNLPEEWTLDFIILLSLSCITMIGMYLLEFPQLRLFFTVLRSIVFLLIGIPFGNFLDIEYILLFSIVMDYSFVFRSPVGGIISASILIVSMALQFPMKIYFVSKPGLDFISLLSYFLVGSVFAVICTFLRVLLDMVATSENQIAGLNEIVSQLIGVNRGYLKYASKVEKETIENERNRIVQELHDIVGKAFTNIHAMMDASLKHPPDDSNEDALLHTWVKEQAQTGLSETRSVLYRLREIKEAELTGMKALLQLINTFKEATKVKVRVTWGNFPWNILVRADTVIQQVIQESLVNAFRHGKATDIDIQFWIDPNDLIINILDNGIGGNSAKKGIGQSSMEKRVADIGGSIKFFSNSEGYRVYLTIPRERVISNEETEDTYR